MTVILLPSEMNDLPSISAEYSRRIRRARHLMSEQNLDALLLFTGPNLVYFTGMPCSRSGSRPFIYLLPLEGDPTLIVHGGRQYEAEQLTGVGDVRTYATLSRLPLAIMTTLISERRMSAGRIGVELGNEMVLDLPVAEFLALKKAVPEADFVDASPLLWQLRMIKSEPEVARVAHACTITLEAYERTFRAIRPGMREVEIEAMMLGHMIALGGRNPWVLITSGNGNYDLVSKGGGGRRVDVGDMVWMDCGCAVDGYYSDFGRAAVLGGPTPVQTEAQRIIHEITHMGIEMMQPGVPVAEIAIRCNEAVQNLALPASSYISDLAGRVGHGLGMVTTELPSLNTSDPTRLQAGMIVTIEPGIATEYGTFHVEENVLITEAGPQVLSEGHWEIWSI